MSRSAARLRLAGKETSPLPREHDMHTTATTVGQSQSSARVLRPVWVVSAVASTAVGHILAAGVIIPPVTRRLTRR